MPSGGDGFLILFASTMNPQIFFFDVKSNWYAKSLDLRYKILREPLGLKFTPEELTKDETDIHVCAVIDGNVVACLSLTNTGGNKLKVRQVAVDSAHQNKGLGNFLNNAAEEYAVKNGFVELNCHARKSAVQFYQNLGYKIVGEEFVEVTIPHYKMEKSLI